MPSLEEAISRDAELARLVREGFLAGRRAALRAVLERRTIGAAAEKAIA